MTSSENFSTLPRLPSQQTRLSMSRVIWAWVFGAIFFQISAGAVYASFARQLGASEATFGFLAGVYPLMGFLQLFAARLLQGRFRARTMMLASGLFCRFLWVLAASLPLLNELLGGPLSLPTLLNLFVGCIVLSAIGQAFTGPSFFSWMSALVPGRVGPAFWARRQQVGTFAGIFAVLLGGYLGDQAARFKDLSEGAFPPLLLYSAILTVAAICGVLDIAFFLGVREPPTLEEKPENAALWPSIRAAWADRGVRRYLRFVICGVVGFATTGPMVYLFCLEFLGWEKTLTGFVLTVCPLAGMALASRFWGATIQKYGARPVLRFTSALLILIPLVWIFALPTSTIALAIAIFLSGILASSYEISNFNFITRAAPHLPRPTLTALFGICAGTTFALTSWLAGIFAQEMVGFRAEIAGLQFVNYHFVFLFSLVPRALNALVFAPRLQEKDAPAMREALNEVGENFAAAFGARFGRFFEARGE